VIGQASFTTGTAAASQSGTNGPWFLSFDASGNLWVDDSNNFRVLEFAPPFANGMNAKVVIGQSGFASTSGFSQTWFNYPGGLAFDSSGNLWVSDIGNGAVLRFPPPFSNGEASNLVIGQGQSTLTLPRGLILDSSGNLWVGDSGNDRVLRFSPPFSSGASANLIIGQGDYLSNGEIPTQSRLTSAGGVALDQSGNLWVSDFYSNRILRFSPPFINGMNANLVIGQANFTSSAPSTVQTGLSNPKYFVSDPSGNLWVSDQDNNRVVMFAPPFSNGMAAKLVLGQSTFTASARATSQGGLSGPAGIAFDSSGNLWVADHNNNRTLMFAPPFSNGMGANLVVGQKSFTASLPATSQSGMSRPEGVSFDPRGNLWVADQVNNRILRFSPPFTLGMSANLVIGQAGFGGGASGTGASGLYLPRMLAFDSAGNLWVSEQNNNRVMKFACGSECPQSSVSFSFSVLGGGTGSSSPTIAYLSGGIPQTATLTGQPKAISVDYGSAWTVSGTLQGSSPSERWLTPQATTGKATTNQTVGFTYYHQFNVTFGYQVNGGGTGYTPPSLNYTQFGSTRTAAAGLSAWVDASTSYSYPAQLVGSSSSERWAATAPSGTFSSAASISAPYFHQYSVTASYSVTGGGSPQGPVLSSTQFGASFSTTLASTASSFWLDNNTGWSLTNPLGGSSGSERWVSNLTSGTITGTTTLASAGSSSVIYLHHLMLTTSANHTRGGYESPQSNWFQSGSSASISATPSQGYRFTGWTGTGTASYTGPNNPATITVNSPVAETAVFEAAATSTTTTSTSSFSTASTSTSQTSTSTSQTSTSGGGGGIPEFPYQLVSTAALTVLLVASYLILLRRRSVQGLRD
jgi:sugar lactone lactonase YvrE